MARPRKIPPPLPSRDDILEYVRESPRRVGRREIARAFGLTSEQRPALRDILRELEGDGLVERRGGRRMTARGRLPEVAVVEVTGVDVDGEVLARPLARPEDEEPPVIHMAAPRRGHPALGPGDRVLARLTHLGGNAYQGRTMRRLAATPSVVLGIYDEVGGEGRIRPVDRRSRRDFVVPIGEGGSAEPGDLVEAEVRPSRRLGLGRARVTRRLEKGPRSVSLIALHEHGIPTRFSEEALAQAAAAGAAPLADREDLRDLPLVTIDGADARDFDDAVWAEPDPETAGGWHLLVAIADVAGYVRPGDALDAAGRERGNSVYFPDRVVPMLPEALSNGWCSLNPGEDRPCLAVHLWIDAEGRRRRHRFIRGMMRSAARLTYSQAQAAAEGRTDETTKPLTKPVIAPLFGAYRALARDRERRGVLDLDLPERRVVVAEDGTVAGIETRPRYDSHRLIEEFMIAANAAAAETLHKGRKTCMYRVHDAPAADKLEALRESLDGLGLKLARGQTVKPAHFNRILKAVEASADAPMVNELILRTQAQAEYTPDNIGHFGLGLRRYCHFTSPIRRYADLLVHRALISHLRLGEGGLAEEARGWEELGAALSTAERRAAQAERDAVDRFAAAFMADRIGATFSGRITGVTRFGLFVALDETGVDGLVPKRSLPADLYHHDAKRHRLKGRRSGREYRLGERVEVRRAEADSATGGMVFHLLDAGDAPPWRGPRGRRTKKGR